MTKHYLRHVISVCCFFCFSLTLAAQIPCSPSGDIIIYSNYDGGYLNINVDENIPNLKIGIVSYEPTQVTLSGPYVGNVTAVRLVSYYPSGSGNGHCDNNITSSGVSGVSPNIVTVVGLQPATLQDPNGYLFILCSYSCSNGNSGGCNTPQQIQDYFNTYWTGSYRRHYTQYGCWCGTYDISQPLGNCCGAPVSSGNAPPTITPPADTICVGQSTTLVASGYSSYSWSPSTGLNTTSGSTVIASPSTTTTYTVTSTGTCGNATAQVTVTVATPATVSLTVTPPTDTICAGQSATLTASGLGNYTWSPSTGLNTTTGPVVIASPSSTTTYTVSGTAPCTTGTATVQVVVAPGVQPTISVSPHLDTICQGGSITLTATGSNGQVTWSPSGSLNTSTGNVVVATPSSTTTYTATIDNACSTATDTAKIVVLNLPDPVAAFTASVSGLTATFNNNSNGGTSYFWDFGDGTGTSTSPNPVYTYGASGNYTVILIVFNECGSDTFVRNVFVESVGIYENENLVNIPVIYNGNVISHIAIPHSAEVTGITLFDVRGRELYRRSSADNVVQMEGLPLSAGVYVLSIIDQYQKEYRTKIVVSR